ncbi:LysR family transcriptional regulator [Leucobacter aridicollis]|uniref:LysR family transcriptional regulator n=1 Tax=Leucobacter aridicollis TaxID=283878 RepID=UPI000EB1C957|nr:LysR family transcriptional regulator [Leucobacter aridicollis]MCS3428502.1 DNA-binding transcriptional LysR family regulator [Leucobacter aridicollis]
MELQQMRYVVAVAEERNFTRAAERCRVVQSALSHQVKALERELGVRLFARTSRRVELTAAGEAFLPHARASLESAERAHADAASAAGEVRGTLTIGLIPTVTAVDAPAALAAFHRAHPAVQIALRGGGSNEFVAAIAAGRMDVAVLGLPEGEPPSGVAHRELVRERFVAVVGEQHPLAGKRRVRLAEIADETFVDFPVSTPGRAQSDLAFAAAGVHREVAFEVMDMGIIVELVRHGLVVALLAPALVAGVPGVATVELADGPGRVEYLAWSEFNPSPAALAFLRTVERGGLARG